MYREAMKQPEALRLADALDDEFTRGRISNHNGRKAAVELRRLHDAVVADSDKVYALLRQALEALESDPISHAGLVSRKQAITVLRQALVDVDDMSRKRVDEKAKHEHEPVAWADRIIDDLAELFDKDRIREADSGDALIRLHEAIAVVEEASKLYNKQPTKIFGPSLEEILNSAGFYRKREWISLTDGEIDILSCEMVKGDKSVNWLCKVLEAKLKEKNT